MFCLVSCFYLVSCLVLCLVFSCLVLFYRVSSFLVLSCLALYCLVLPLTLNSRASLLSSLSLSCSSCGGHDTPGTSAPECGRPGQRWHIPRFLLYTIEDRFSKCGAFLVGIGFKDKTFVVTIFFLSWLRFCPWCWFFCLH